MKIYPSLEDINQIIAHSENPVSESFLALMGDKRFLMSDTGQSFIMYGEKGRSWIALGAPIGRKNEAPDLINDFMRTAKAAGFSPAFYAVRERHLSLFQGSKLKFQKIGEMALLSISDFSLDGKERAKFRQTRNRAARDGLSFQIKTVSKNSPEMDRLKVISDDWLKQQSGEEKGFSLGKFDRDVLCNQPIALAMKEGEIVGFSNLWASHSRAELSMDLMRYLGSASFGIIDFLIVETILWGREKGFKSFSLGMAPLAGLDKEDHRSVMSSLCRFAFKHGDKFYSFQGIRQFKKKFNPEWEAVYLLAPTQLHMPRALKNLALLSAGNLKGLFRRP